jgi:hypothetical protein
MWGKRRKRMSKREVLGLIAKAMAQAEQQEGEQEPEAVPYPEGTPVRVAPPGRAGLRPADVRVDNTAGPQPLASEQNVAQPQRDLPAQRTGESAHRTSLG